ncbi:MAG: hypothetical protein HOV79_00570 [Hamadaea sp.]|nr:hypothetical protein [Hamadaea sp.]
MICIDGVDYASAAEIAEQLGRDVTPDAVRRWADRDGLTARRLGRRVVYRIDEAEHIECDKRYATPGRPRGT